jgi:hypothetical protein
MVSVVTAGGGVTDGAAGVGADVGIGASIKWGACDVESGGGGGVAEV